MIQEFHHEHLLKENSDTNLKRYTHPPSNFWYLVGIVLPGIPETSSIFHHSNMDLLALIDTWAGAVLRVSEEVMNPKLRYMDTPSDEL